MSIWSRDYMKDGNRRLLPVGWGAVHVIIALNVVMLLAWMLARSSRSTGFFKDFIYTSAEALSQGYVWTLVTAAFAHQEIWHIFINLFLLFAFGRSVEGEIGTRRFWIFYLAAAAVASLAHCFVDFFTTGRDIGLGASGAISAVIAFFCFRHARTRILLFFVLPVPAIAVLVIWVGMDLWGLIAQSRGVVTHIGHGAHLGGAAFGALYWFLFASGRFRVRRRRQHAPVAEVVPVRRRRKRRRRRESTEPPAGGVDRDELDRILAKISEKGGVDKLPMSEREFLEEMSRRLGQDD